MCMEAIASAAAGQMKKPGQGMPSAQLPAMPGAPAAAPSITDLLGGQKTERSPIVTGLLGGSGPDANIPQPSKEDEPTWSKLQPPRDLDLLSLLKLMGK